MKAIQTLTALALILGGSAAIAEDIKPGLWKISLESSVAASPGWNPEPFVLTQCLTEDDARNPDRLLAGMGGQGVTGCDFLNRDYSSGHVRFDLNCAGQLGLTGHGEMSFSATRLDGTLDVSFADAGQGGQNTAMQNKLHAVYLGSCNAAGGTAPAPPSAMVAPVPPAE
ncbi:DUF3617 domain-containing protein [Methylomagnum sp.]